MKKATVTISFDEERLSALKMYMEQKNVKLEDELEKAIENLYTKNVPAGVRGFIDMKYNPKIEAAARQIKKKHSFSSAVGATAPSDDKTDTVGE
ncbi:MAG: hypothetical protein IKB86_04765 [Clostridia bacterium]|nr:hypothetical protein [Oscillospiraceae bacterium]MBR2861132.1 hypothetical protein [Clostridia bacterium]